MSDDKPEGAIEPEDLKPPPVPEDPGEAESPLTTVAIEVKQGLWGVGQERRTKLSKAGWNVKEVEAEVVRLLNK